MTDGIDKTPPPWSATHIFQILQHTLGDRRHSSTPVEDAVWFRRAQNLLYSASLSPDVASRVLSCFLFLESGFTSLRTENPKTVSYLKKMCQHAKQVHEDFYATQSRVNHSKDVTDSDSHCVPQSHEQPQDEVTFVATFMEPFLNGEIPSPRKCLECVLGPSPGDVDEGSEKNDLLQVLEQLFSRVLQTLQGGGQSQMDKTVGHMPSETDNPSDDAAQKSVLHAARGDVKRLDTTGANVSSSSTQTPALSEATSQPLKDSFPASHLSLIDLLFGSESRDTEMLCAPEFHDTDLQQWLSFNKRSTFCDSTGGHLPFRTRTIDEMRQQAVADELHVNRTTVVVREGRTIMAPEWSTTQKESDSGPQTSNLAQSPPENETLRENEGEADKNGSQAGLLQQGCSVATEEGVKKQESNTTWVEDGELVMIGGRLVIQPAGRAKKKQKKDPNDNKNGNKDNQGPHKKGSSKRLNQGGIEELNASLLGKNESNVAPSHSSKSNDSDISSGKKKGSEDESQGLSSKTRPSRTEESTKTVVNVSSTGKRKRKNDNTTSKVSNSGFTSSTRVVPTHNVPLLSREEIIQLLEGWQISNTLREAFLVGLEPASSDVSPESPKMALKLGNPETSE
ncbi:unnamed protein product [Phytomonas sp. EM1]|nr:unnamed protein product [Phytomonas sp. EM1]|eukprot:CCW63073.1 unnamed protein product [Phytomonas sp. isolate EM1]